MFSALMISTALSVMPATRPHDPHVGFVLIENRVVEQIGPFWDREDCEFVGKGIVNPRERSYPPAHIRQGLTRRFA
ncbi:hypothetical protein [Brucella anthropi]|uniref:hypothetical protein n=1 Tax=Brucella anthropi TaxID=529 RepID=UPI000DF8F046|nr:hypothetical protein [Brucella anthropi]SUB56225.1 Uncharacterised protein [Brucella anthropi]